MYFPLRYIRNVDAYREFIPLGRRERAYKKLTVRVSILYPILRDRRVFGANLARRPSRPS